MKRLRTLACLLLLPLAGCSTLADTFNPSESEGYIGRKGPNIMGGVRMDVMRIGDPKSKGLAVPFYILDTPFSLALDVAFLPFTIPYVLISGTPKREIKAER